MARRNRSTLAPRHREAIQSGILIKRLQDFSVCDVTNEATKRHLMTDGQVRAALGLLRKTIPDLAVTQHVGDPENPVQTSLTISFKPAVLRIA